MTDTVSSQPSRWLYRGRYLSIADRQGWEFVVREGARGVVAIIALTGEGALVLTEQHRPAVEKQVIDIPAGLVGDEAARSEENHEQAARHELEEETGYRAATMVHIFDRPTSPGLTNEMVSYYFADNPVKVGPGGGTGDEKIKVHVVSVQDIDDWLAAAERQGMLIDPKVQLALHYVARILLRG